MNTARHLILNNGRDITSDVKFCKYNTSTGKYDVTFQNDQTYHYNYQSIEWIRDPENLNPALVRIMHGGREFYKIQEISVFHAPSAEYWNICFSDGSKKTYNRRDLDVKFSCLDEEEAGSCISYLRRIAAINELKNDDGDVLLQKQYEKLAFVGGDTAMAVYLNPSGHKIRTYRKDSFIFPFGGNASQFQAVQNAGRSQISVIQGPPGTGKTQTILNIIANLLLEGKTVQIVSNNNSATENVLEKLSSPKYNMDFLVAPLGKAENKKAFVQSQTGFYPDLSTWEMVSEKQEELLSQINKAAAELSESFAKQERLALVRQEMDSLLLEMQYFDQYCRETGLACSEIMPRHRLKSETLMRLWQECYGFSEKDRAVSFWFKIKSAFIYGISDWRYYSGSLTSIITLLQNLFYQAKKTELEDETGSLETYLKSVDAKGKMDRLTADSMDYLRAKLFDRFGRQTERKTFSEDDLWKNAGEVVKEYPVVLSTTFSSLSSLRGVTYDYLIMDEASQVDVATGALSLSCAKNAVIVGDLKQLPNVVGDEMRKRSDAVFGSYKLHQGYSFSENSFLRSICSVLPDVPQTLLREHYRCHPKIIGFCNQKFYQNELIIMTEDHSEPDTLEVFKTAAGNHRRGHVNQRQIDVTLREALPVLKDSKPEEIGIVAPYKDQVSAIAGQLDTDKIEVHTVHKFQGREKDTIVLTTVDDVISDFSDDPYLLNVAVSRAKKRLILVASKNEQPADSNIGDLISYIEYNNFQVVESEIYSVFDLLYQQYTAARIAYLKKHAKVSSFDSENLMYGVIMDLLAERPELTLNVICHQPLHMLIRDMTRLHDEERRYLTNTATHLDFLIYNKISKKPVLAIEVDGFHFHKSGTLQYERDKIKDRILTLYEIPFFRFPTNGSGEIERIRGFLEEYEKNR